MAAKTQTVLRLAKWMHETCAELYPAGKANPWARVSPEAKARYCHVARKLLENPPPFLTKPK